MQKTLNYLNDTHCMSKIGGEWRVCQLSGSSVWTLEGNRVCSRTKKMLWKRFSEAMFYYPEEGVDLQVQDIVLINDEHGVPLTYYVVDTGVDASTGKKTYIVGR